MSQQTVLRLAVRNSGGSNTNRRPVLPKPEGPKRSISVGPTQQTLLLPAFQSFPMFAGTDRAFAGARVIGGSPDQAHVAFDLRRVDRKGFLKNPEQTAVSIRFQAARRRRNRFGAGGTAEIPLHVSKFQLISLQNLTRRQC